MMTDSGDELIRLFEAEFGQIETGFVLNKSPIVQMVRYEPSQNGIAYISTLGLNKLPKTPRFEWYMEFQATLSSDHAASLLGHYALKYIQNQIESPKRGNYLVFDGGQGSFWKKSNACGLYFTHPFFRSSSFLNNIGKCGVILVWIVPIVASELRILETEGWSELERYWDMNDINLHTPNRK